MDYSTAFDKLKTFRNNSKDITPEIANDWKIETDYYYKQGTRVIISSESLGLNINGGESGRFMEKNFLSGDIISVDGRIASFKNQIINYNLAYTQEGFLSEEDFYIAKDLIEQMEQITPFKPSELKVSSIYRSMKDEYYIFGGSPIKEGLYMNHRLVIEKRTLDEKTQKKKFLIKIDKEKYINNKEFVFQGLVQRTAKIKLIEEFESVPDDVFDRVEQEIYSNFFSTFLGLPSKKKPKLIEVNKKYYYKDELIELNNEFYLFEGRRESNELIQLSTRGGYWQNRSFIKINVDKFLDAIEKALEENNFPLDLNDDIRIDDKYYGYADDYTTKRKIYTLS